MWFAVYDGGVSRYDGKRWTTFTTEDGLVHNKVRTILEDRDGNLWFGAEGGGVSRYDGTTWTTFSTERGLVDNRVRDIVQDRKGRFWFGTAGGVSRFDGKRWTTYTKEHGLAHKDVRAILEDRDGKLWFGTYYRGVSRFDGKRWVTFTTEDGLVHNAVRAILEDREGHFWFGTAGGVSRFDGKRWTDYTSEDGLAQDDVNAIAQDREGHLWFSTRGGVSRYDKGSFTTFAMYDGLPDNYVPAIAQDRDGGLWFGTWRGGVSRYDGKTLTTFTTEDGLAHNEVRAILEDQDGHLWFGTSGGVSRYDGKTFTTFTTEDGLAHNWVRAILEDREGDLWFGTWGGGVSRYDPSASSGQAAWTAFTVADGFANGRIAAMLEDREGDLWFGVRWGGLSRYDGRQITTFNPTQDVAYTWVWSLSQDRAGDFWCGTWSGGARRFDGERWTTFKTRDGLTNNVVTSTLCDRDGHLWFATYGGGVSRYDGKVFQTMRQEDGLAGNDVRSLFQDQEGRLWFGTQNSGVTCYRPPSSSPPPVSIDAVVANRRYQDVSDVSLVSGTELITFEFHGVSFKTRPDGMVYRYRLVGYDAGWRTTRARQAEYQNLPRGSYTFEVEAVDRDMVYSDAPATMALTIRLPYERIGLLSALGIAVLLIAWQTVRVLHRDRRLRESVAALSDANKDLFGANRQLQREGAVARVRAQVQAMEQASDFERVLSLVSEDLRAVGLTFDTCGIDVLDEPVDEPTMGYFEQHGFRYTTYAIDPEGSVTDRSYHVQAPFPEVIQETVERFIAGQPWRARTEQNAIVEVPISGYGRLRLTASDRKEFTEDDIEALRDFASAIALGYARYLDIREIQEQTQRKSAFLASMSHDLRTPMNAIKGFTSMVLRRIGDTLPERHRDNLSKVLQAADVLLEMINDLMDLSKIEAGRMDVNPEPFNVKSLIATCCATVSPLVAEKADVVLNTEVSEDVGQANTDQGRLRRMVINLLSNAIKFTDSGTVTINATTEGEQLVVAVADTGKGIPADEIDTIFDEYRQVKGSDTEGKGTGLGLSITRKFAELLGGSIGVESRVDVGSTFEVRIPENYEGKSEDY